VQKRPSSFVRATSALFFILGAGLLLTAQGCRAQSSTGVLSPETARRIAVTIRQRAHVPYNVDVKATGRKPSAVVPGYDEVTVSFIVQGQPPQVRTFLLSSDEKTVAQFNSFDLDQNLRDLVAEDGRPSRGGPESAPVRIVVFDDLECPFCARMHAQLFPAILARYKDNVRIVYKDFPLLSIHPWALHAAIDAGCLSAESAPAYWRYVDAIHAEMPEIGKDKAVNTQNSAPDTAEKMLTRANSDLDRIALDEAQKLKVNKAKVSVCMAKQDDARVQTTLKEGEKLGVEGVPALFINGQFINGAVPVEYVWKAIDDALVAQGITPPPAVPLPPAPQGQ
jgi:protein-disulfide isomerase